MDNEKIGKDKFQEESIAPMHTAEHLLNRTMVNMFGCERSRNAHVERKKSKIAYSLPRCPSEEEVQQIVVTMNHLITENLPVFAEYCRIDKLPEDVSLDHLPNGSIQNDSVRLVRIGNYDVCPCIGIHVGRTGVLGQFILLGVNWDEERHSFRIRFKLNVANADKTLC